MKPVKIEDHQEHKMMEFKGKTYLVPVIPHIDAQILREIDKGGGFDMRSWHNKHNISLLKFWRPRCETTHCRAGWAIHLAGDLGRKLECELGSGNAGWLIYRASRPGKKAPSFLESNEYAMRDMRACAAEDPLP